MIETESVAIKRPRSANSRRHKRSKTSKKTISNDSNSINTDSNGIRTESCITNLPEKCVYKSRAERRRSKKEDKNYKSNIMKKQSEKNSFPPNNKDSTIFQPDEKSSKPSTNKSAKQKTIKKKSNSKPKLTESTLYDDDYVVKKEEIDPNIAKEIINNSLIVDINPAEWLFTNEVSDGDSEIEFEFSKEWDDSYFDREEEILDKYYNWELIPRIHPMLVENLGLSGISAPNALQKKVLPAALFRKDCIIKSETGSGKTLCFAIPILHNIIADQKGPYGYKLETSSETRLASLILMPTRELASQVVNHIELLLGLHTEILVQRVIGGVCREKQIRLLHRRPHVIVASPGRLVDLLRLSSTTEVDLERSITKPPKEFVKAICEGSLVQLLRTVRWLVIDEADRLLRDTGDAEMKTILNSLYETIETKKLQTFVVSATLQLTKDFNKEIPIKQVPKAILQEQMDWQAVKAEDGKIELLPLDVVSVNINNEEKQLVPAPFSKPTTDTRSLSSVLQVTTEVASIVRLRAPKFTEVITLESENTKPEEELTENTSTLPSLLSLLQVSATKNSQAEGMLLRMIIDHYFSINFDANEIKRNRVKWINWRERPVSKVIIFVNSVSYVSRLVALLALALSPASHKATAKVKKDFQSNINSWVPQSIGVELTQGGLFNSSDNTTDIDKAETDVNLENNEYKKQNNKNIEEELSELWGLAIPRVLGLTGRMPQKRRMMIIDKFRRSEQSILVATDVAARGLDIKEVDLVVHFQPPRGAEAFIHRSGRAGRAGRQGKVGIILAPDNIEWWKKLLPLVSMPNSLGEPATLSLRKFRDLAIEKSEAKAYEVIMHHYSELDKLLRKSRNFDDGSDSEEENQIVVDSDSIATVIARAAEEFKELIKTHRQRAMVRVDN